MLRLIINATSSIAGFLKRETLPYAPEAWHSLASVKTGCEINFYRLLPVRTLTGIHADIMEQEWANAGPPAEIAGADGAI